MHERDGSSRFHNGIDVNTTTGGRFFSCVAGRITEVELDTGAGYAGNNYRIVLRVSSSVKIDYHFETGGSVSEEDRRAAILVAPGDRVVAGQHIGNLVSLNDNAHVHFGVSDHRLTEQVCTLTYFADDAAARFEALYDSGIEKRPSSHPDLCETAY